jgi:transposase
VIILFRHQQVLIHTYRDTQAIIEYICSESNKVFNGAFYYARQVDFKAHCYATKAELDQELKRNRLFQAMYSQAAQQTCHSVFESFKSFKALNKLFRKGELAAQPRPPKYRKDGLNVISYSKQALKLINGNIRIPLGSKVKTWFGIGSFTIPMSANLDFKEILELRILPRNQCFWAEFV